MDEEKILQQAQQNGEWLMGRLRALSAKHSCISEVRGKGLMIGIELKVESKPTLQAAQARGLLVLASGETVVRLLPPLNTPRADLEKALSILDEVLPA
jgi:acetylornithine/succinyldiaminopimelate/putrescine aminotransferase